MTRLIVILIVGVPFGAADLQPLSALPNSAQGSFVIRQRAVPGEPWTVAGEYGAIFGRKNGTFEAWEWPVKLISHLRVSVDLQDYDVPIDVNSLAASITATPSETTITYSHAAFTIKQHAFAPRGRERPAAASVVYYEFESVRPMTITFSFTPEMLPMWPAPQFGRPDGEWVKTGKSGFYVLHTSKQGFSGIIAMPGTEPGILPPYQERPQTYPLQFKLHFDPKNDAGRVYPLIMAVEDGSNPAEQVSHINQAIEPLRKKTEEYYENFFDSRTTVETPNPDFDSAIRWSELAIDQMQVMYQGKIGLVAGYYESADSARPGYAWFFGRDTLWTTYAINSYGDFALTRAALDFLIERQRADGKIMHEFSQSAAAIDWTQTPYFYASADSTPLLVMAMWDYLRASGDLNYVRQNWDSVRKAFQFERAHDSDKDGIYENTEGTGWVESWPPGMPHQEIYLAALDQQSCEAMSQLAAAVGDQQLASSAADKAEKIGKTIEAEYLDKDSFYAFSRNADGTLDTTPSIYPSVAWWQGTYGLARAGRMLSRWALPEFSTDWGTRDISGASSYFDPISYHQGSVWPLFTGWVSLAEYRAGRSLSAYAHLHQNIQLTWLQDLGSATELLSGEFYQPLGRSSSHQMWSSAMIVSPAMRGLFGLQPDVMHSTLFVDPHLPATWDHARIRNVHVGKQELELEFTRDGHGLHVRATSAQPGVLCLSQARSGKSCNEPAAKEHDLILPLPAVEFALPDQAVRQGDRTHTIKVEDETYSDHNALLKVAAPGDTEAKLFVRANRPNVSCDQQPIPGGQIALHFPAGNGYEELTVTCRW